MARFQSVDGLSLYYETNGEGPVVLCLSGLTRSVRDFDYVAPYLTGVTRVAMDYRGRGKSDWAEDFTTYSIPQEAADALALMDHLGHDKFAILGTSRGGLIAMALAMMAPDRLLGVCFNDIGPEIDMEGLDVIMGYLGRNPVWKTREEAIRQRPDIMKGFANVPMSRWTSEVDHLYQETDTGLVNRYDPKLRDAVMAAGAAGAPDLWPFFDALAHVPVAVIRGANSDLLSRDTVAEMARRRPDMITAEVPDRAHIPFLDEPSARSAISAWLETLA